MKKFASVFLFFLMLCAILVISSTDVDAASGTCGAEGSNLTWTLDAQGTLTISGTGAMQNWEYSDSVPWYSNRSSVKTVVINRGVTTIGDRAFYNCTCLTDLTIPDSVTTIGNYAFRNCTGLTSVTIPDSVITIGSYAFYNCTGLTQINFNAVNMNDLSSSNCVFYKAGQSGTGIKVTIGKQVTKIPAYLFCPYSSSSYSSKLTTVEFADGSVCKSIGKNSFSYCTSLTGVYISDLKAWCEIEFGSNTSNPLCYAEKLYLNNTLITELEIPDGVTAIGEYAFRNCTGLTTVTIPDSVTTIGYDTFRDCTSLTSVTIPDSVTTIGGSAFYYCTSLKSVTIPDSVTTIGEHAFLKCSSLTSITIPDSVTTIGNYTFSHCYGLTSVTIPDSVTTIGDYAFYGCSRLNHVAYTGDQSQWEKISIGDDNSSLTDTNRHYNAKETDVYWTKNCVNVGLFCEICGKFIVKENSEDGTHSYTDAGDISCNDCDFVQSLSSISVYQKPSNLKYELFTGILNVEDGLLQARYNDGGLIKIEMEPDMVSGFDNAKLGTQTLTVTYEGKTATFTVEIVPGVPNSVKIITMPETLNYITGAALDLTGLSLLACYPGDLTVEIPLADITVSSVDMTTPGIKTVDVGFKGISTTFSIYVHTKQVVTLDSTTYPESSHNYASGTNDSKTFTSPGASSLTLTFNSSSYTESNYDWIYLYDGAGNQVGKYSGSLANKVVTIPGDTFTIKLTSDSSVNKYGYAFSSIVAETILHIYDNGACTICGQFEHGLILTENTVINENLEHDIYIDLNGYNLSGTIITNGYAVYGMDSTTNGYTCESIGYFNCVDENGNAIIPVAHFKSNITGSVKRYMAIKDENGYSFHRFYLGITHQTLRPTTTGVGYKAVFYADEMVIAQLDENNAFGFTMQLEGNKAVTAYKDRASFVSGKTVTLRIDNYDIGRYGEAALSAKVMLQLADGMVIESTDCTMTMRSMLEALNDMTLTAEQQTAVKAMIEKFAIIKTWDTENLYA